MDVYFVGGSTVERHGAEDLQRLLTRDDGITWVDIPEVDDEAAAVLSDVFGFHPMAIRSCAERNRVPKIHAYPDYFFFTLHGPELGSAGHVHYIELDQLIGHNYVVTVHGPVDPTVDPDVPLPGDRGPCWPASRRAGSRRRCRPRCRTPSSRR